MSCSRNFNTKSYSHYHPPPLKLPFETGAIEPAVISEIRTVILQAVAGAQIYFEGTPFTVKPQSRIKTVQRPVVELFKRIARQRGPLFIQQVEDVQPHNKSSPLQAVGPATRPGGLVIIAYGDPKGCTLIIFYLKGRYVQSHEPLNAGFFDEAR